VKEQEERCIPWDPIPHEYNRLSDLSITNFGEVGVERTEGVACILHSSGPDAAPRRRHRWRIFFEATRAFRLRPVVFGEWPEALPITLPPKSWSSSVNRRVALWEITSSVYVAQSIDPGDRDEARHYVLMNHDMAYEVIAFGYCVEDLGEYQSPIHP